MRTPTAPQRSRTAGAAVVVAALAGAAVAGCGKDNRPATWEYLSPVVFQPNCATASCHSPAAAVAGLDFSTPDRGYTSLMDLWVWVIDPNGTPDNGCKPIEGTNACQRNHRELVVPNDPSQSRLVNMLRARNAPRMPPDRPLAEGDIELVERWILNGAGRLGGPKPVDAGTSATAGHGGAGGGGGAGGAGGAAGGGGAGGGGGRGGAGGSVDAGTTVDAAGAG